MEDIVQYPDGKETHGMDGSVVPRSLSRSQEDELGAMVSDDTGGAIEINQTIPMNIIECDAKGRLKKAFVLDPAAQDRLRKANRVAPSVPGKPGQRQGKLMSFEEAANVDPNSNSIEMVQTSAFKRKQTYEEKAAEEAMNERSAAPQKFVGEVRYNPEHATPLPSKPTEPNEFDMVMTHPRTKVRFKGQFGSTSVLYNLVHVHEDFKLVMLQYSADGQFNEAPSGDQPVLVQIEDRSYNCFPGPQVPLLPGSTLLITIYFIESEVSNGEER
jgi:hypothetical protein